MEPNCVDPRAIQDWELEAYADGKELPKVLEHLTRCPACRNRLGESIEIERGLRQVLYRFDCPSVDRLRDFWWGYLPAEERQPIQSHLGTCSHCTVELADLAELVESEREEPTDTLLARARQMATELRLAVASLISPSPRQGWALRGEMREVLLYNADGVAVSINLQQDKAGTCMLLGQVLSSELPVPSGGYARLTAREHEVSPAQVPLDANGSFAIPDLRPDVYQLLINLPDRRIVVPNLPLKTES